MKTSVDKLRQCGLNHELHHNDHCVQWPESFRPRIWCNRDNCIPAGVPKEGLGNIVGMIANQYGPTSFFFTGGPAPRLPVSFYRDTDAAPATTS